MTDSDFIFYPGMDYVGYDITRATNKTIDELKIICKKNKKCLGFNTLGYLKWDISIDNLKSIPMFATGDSGLYVYSKRYNKIKKTRFLGF